MKAEGFRKQERMVSTQLIETLFSDCHSVVIFPLRVVFKTIPRIKTGVPVQLLISVPKKRFKHAVDRNRVKRQIREAYRHHRQLLYPAVTSDNTLLLGVIWTSDHHAPTASIDGRVEKLFAKIAGKLSTASSVPASS